MAELATVLSEVDQEKKRHLCRMARLINDLQDVRKIVVTMLKECEQVRDEYISEIYGEIGKGGDESDAFYDDDDDESDDSQSR